ncbi:hypothetical protein RFI_32673 [Reticulomyxa filosa]|uniref:Uncharacterized protein n=1 Tax=Reticulomyxa filosa TaxID=46433 RepID=X6LS48_RETFI|nr:hypothetical protein RFI_32673 [Reticulomyxa filosa]|eukprot:ETO04723.1 hypothetical protein RFI_32673 [Reticulomyxa filosa]
MRSYNIGYRICLGSMIYEWFRDQEYKSFMFKKKLQCNHQRKYNKNGNKSNERILSSIETLNHAELINTFSKQLNVEFDELYNRMAVKQALVAKAKIYGIQNESFYRRDESTKPIFNYTLMNESNSISFINQSFPNLFIVLKRLIMNGFNIILIHVCSNAK